MNYELIGEIFAALKMNRMRTFLTGFAIAWGIFMLVALLAVGNGFSNAMFANFRYMSQNSVSLYAGRTSMPYGGRQKGRQIRFSMADCEWMRTHLEGCKSLSPIFNLWNGSIAYGTLQFDANITGVNEVYRDLRVLEVKHGRFVNAMDMHERRKAVVIDENTARKLFGVAELAVGKMVRLTNGVNFQVVGVTEAEYEDSRPSIFIPLATANVIYNPSGWVYDVSYELEGVETAEEAKVYGERLREQLAQYYGYDPADRNAIWVANRIESYEQSKMIFNGISMFIWVIGIGTLIAGIVGVSNIMLITVKERTREFGIRKALGATPNSILGLVVLESLVITLIFGYIGMMMGIGLSEILCVFFPEGGGSSMQPKFLSNPTVDLGIVFSATMVLVVAGVLAGYMPARNAVKIKPIEAMNAK